MQWTQLRSQTNWASTHCVTATGTSRPPVQPVAMACMKASTGWPISWRIRSEAGVEGLFWARGGVTWGYQIIWFGLFTFDFFFANVCLLEPSDGLCKWTYHTCSHIKIYMDTWTHIEVCVNKHMSTQTLTSLLIGGFSVKWCEMDLKTHYQSSIQYNTPSQNSHYLSMHSLSALWSLCILIELIKVNVFS